jgi:hypothetical protein
MLPVHIGYKVFVIPNFSMNLLSHFLLETLQNVHTSSTQCVSILSCSLNEYTIRPTITSGI